MPDGRLLRTGEPGAAGPAAHLHPAFRVAAVPLALATALLLPPAALPIWLGLLALTLRATGAGSLTRAEKAKPWVPVLLLVVAVHTLTTVDAAPLGRPSWTGLLRGLVAAGRLLGLAATLALAVRAIPLPALIDGLAWWEPRRRPVLAPRLGVALAVAAGTATAAADEARRIDAAVRLRRGGARVRPWGRALDAGYLVVPLIESLLRRADALTLALQGRVPLRVARGRAPRTLEATLLLAWACALVFLAKGSAG